SSRGRLNWSSMYRRVKKYCLGRAPGLRHARTPRATHNATHGTLMTTMATTPPTDIAMIGAPMAQHLEASPTARQATDEPPPPPVSTRRRDGRPRGARRARARGLPVPAGLGARGAMGGLRRVLAPTPPRLRRRDPPPVAGSRAR